MPADKPVTKAGSAPIVKVGHTFSNRFGSEPNAKSKNPTQPTPQSFGGKG